MRVYMYLIYILLITIIETPLVQANAYGESHIVPAIAYVGETVHAYYKPLKNDSIETIIWWLRVENQSDTRIANGSRYEINTRNHTVNLTIRNVSLSDAGKYITQCGSHWCTGHPSHLEVKELPKLKFKERANKPDIGCHDCLLGWMGRRMNISCIVEGVIQPHDVNISIDKGGHAETKSQNLSRHEYRSQTIYAFHAREADDRQNVTCTVSSSRFSKRLIIKAPLRILKLPDVSDLTLTSSAIENETITCRSPTSQTDFDIVILYNNSWYTVSSPDDAKCTRILQISRYDNGRPIQCCFIYQTFEEPSPGTMCTNSTFLDIRYTPSRAYIKRRRCCENDGDGNTYVELECITGKSNPVSTISWTSNTSVQSTSTEQINSDHEIRKEYSGWTASKALTANITRVHHGQKIGCSVTNIEFPNWHIITEYIINITYRPQITISGVDPGHVLEIKVGDAVNITCDVDSNPAASVHWSRNTSRISAAYKLQDKARASSSPADLVTPVSVAASGTTVLVVVLTVMVVCITRRQIKRKRQGTTKAAALHPPHGQVQQFRNTEVSLLPAAECSDFASVTPSHLRASESANSRPQIEIVNQSPELSTAHAVNSDDQEYSTVVPRNQRTAASQQELAFQIENPTLIYAELDLAPELPQFTKPRKKLLRPTCPLTLLLLPEMLKPQSIRNNGVIVVENTWLFLFRCIYIFKSETKTTLRRALEMHVKFSIFDTYLVISFL
ncbi:uncharacterized protein LOC127879207 isoform X2 [Dreissena polymorpha]|uniref:uncharacterized protein LOC127879207 isoform X2 n=1 Tax=Dreissena polymorpha TaxID=45954 RepID=UPI002264548A|nr:uncharacterized protein LOC127879207 isoform X2 [Dreissena polymorpha]